MKFVVPTGNYGMWSPLKPHQRDYHKFSSVVSDENGRQCACGLPRYKDGPARGQTSRYDNP